MFFSIKEYLFSLSEGRFILGDPSGRIFRVEMRGISKESRSAIYSGNLINFDQQSIEKKIWQGMQKSCSSLNFGPNEVCIVTPTQTSEIDSYFTTQSLKIENQINDFSQLFFSHREFLLNQLFFNIQQNSNSIQTISKKLDCIDEVFSSVQCQFMDFELQCSKISKEDKYCTEDDSGPSNGFKKHGKLHYKNLFRERMFGEKQYRYRLNVEGKAPQILYKERNLSLKISLVDVYDNKIQNQNAISLHMKVFYSNGEEIESTKKGQSFMKGQLNCTLLHGRALFDKVYPREVSRKLDNKKIVLVIYASGMGNTNRECLSRVNPLEIEPMIIYGVKVVTKQNKQHKPKMEVESEECESEFTL